MKLTNENFCLFVSHFPSSSGLNSLQIKIQESPSTSISSLSELSPLSSEIAVNSPSTSSSQSTTDLNEGVLTGAGKHHLGSRGFYKKTFPTAESNR